MGRGSLHSIDNSFSSNSLNECTDHLSGIIWRPKLINTDLIILRLGSRSEVKSDLMEVE